MIQIKRIYEEPSENDGFRILVDRLWPRGINKHLATIDLWLKEVAPSPDLRRLFNHKKDRFNEFSLKYVSELSKNPAVTVLDDILSQRPKITLLYAAKDTTINHAAVLKGFLENKHEIIDK